VGVITLAPAPLFATSMAYFALLIITVIFLVYLAAGGWRRLRLTPLDVPIAAFLAVRILSTVTSVAPAASWRGLEKSGLLLAYYPLAHMALARPRRLAGVYIFIAAAVLAAAAGIAEFGFGTVARVVGRTSGYTTLAEILAVALSLFLALILFQKGRRRIWLGVAAIPPLAALALTFCRGQWLAFAGGVAVIGVLRDRRVLAVLLIFGALAAAVAYYAPAGVASGRFSLGDPAFENYRDVLWRGGLAVVFARPLTGFGPETVQLIFPLRTRFYSPVENVIGWHNDFLQLATESGFIAVAMALWLVVAATALAWRAYVGGKGAVAALGLGLVAATATVLLSGLVGNVVTDPAMLMVFVLLWGLFAPLAARPEEGADGLP